MSENVSGLQYTQDQKKERDILDPAVSAEKVSLFHIQRPSFRKDPKIQSSDHP